MAKDNRKPLSAFVGTAFLASLAWAPQSSVAENPFQLNLLSSGYQLAEGSEGKCGGKKTESEGKCGEKKAGGEGKCGGEKTEGKGKDKDSEGKCGSKKS